MTAVGTASWANELDLEMDVDYGGGVVITFSDQWAYQEYWDLRYDHFVIN